VVALLSIAVVLGGLHGVVTRGPTMPVCRVGSPCSAPATGTVLVFSRGGREVGEARVGNGGRYRVRLAPGVYTVTTGSTRQLGFGLRPATVRVVVNVDRLVDFSIDTGIR
jgi:hypothetical protein